MNFRHGMWAQIRSVRKSSSLDKTSHVKRSSVKIVVVIWCGPIPEQPTDSVGRARMSTSEGMNGAYTTWQVAIVSSWGPCRVVGGSVACHEQSCGSCSRRGDVSVVMCRLSASCCWCGIDRRHRRRCWRIAPGAT